MSHHTPDSDTVSTSELLDLIQADVAGSGRKKSTRSSNGSSSNGSNNNNNAREAGHNSGISHGGSSGSSGSRSGSRGATINSSLNSAQMRELNDRERNDPFSVRLTPQKSRRRAVPFSSGKNSALFDSDNDEDGSEDEDSVGDMSGFDSYKYGQNEKARSRKHKKKVSIHKRQRMPLGGGYGGMFDSHNDDGTANSNGSVGSSNKSDADSLTSSKGDSSSVTSIFSLASRLFAKKRNSKNPYHSSGHSISSRTIASQFNETCLGRMTTSYLALPFRLRYFVQLFSIMAVFMLASLNYFIAMETSHPSQHRNAPLQYSQSNNQQQQYSYIEEGGGASTNRIPRLRVRDPRKFLHSDMKPNELLEMATAKFKQSTRFGMGEPSSKFGGTNRKSETGPFLYGWKSMPRQIYNDFASGLSDDAKTIRHTKNSQHYHNLAQRQGGGFVDHDAETAHVDPRTRAPPKGTVAYVLPIATCYGETTLTGDEYSKFRNLHPAAPNQPKDEEAFRDFALMLRANVHAHSYKNPSSGSVYDYKMHAIIHPRAKKCRSALEDDNDNDNNGIVDRSVELQNLGYHVAVKYSPLSQGSLKDGGESSIKEYMDEVGETQIVDLIRLYAYELEGYDAVVLVDYDTFILGPVDTAVDLIVDSTNNKDQGNNNDGDAGNINSNNNIDAVFSWEHSPSLINPQARASVINLSFFLLRPSKSTFQKLLLRYQNAPFSKTRGWGTLVGRGSFGGWMTTVGFLTYYYDEVANANKIELNRCAYGNTGQDYNNNEDGGESGVLLIANDGKVECGGGNAAGGVAVNLCNECSKSKLDDVLVADLSYCRAPWECGANPAAEADSSPSTTIDTLSSGLCRQFQKLWFGGRLQMEDVHPQLQKGSGKLCIDGEYQPMMLLKSSVAYKPASL